jgi:cysteine-rich repeat protein
MNQFRLYLLVALLGVPSLARAAVCDPSVFGDGVCDCGCGTVDSDCASSDFHGCQVSHCPSGQVPWEHRSSTCMTSACGDGWKDTAAGEACDDGNALASGGCSADCKTVTAGYECGEGASGCHAIYVDAGPVVDAGSVTPDAGSPVDESDAGTDDSKVPARGCATAPGSVTLLGVLAAWAAYRRRAQFSPVRLAP